MVADEAQTAGIRLGCAVTETPLIYLAPTLLLLQQPLVALVPLVVLPLQPTARPAATHRALAMLSLGCSASRLRQPRPLLLLAATW